MLSVNSIALHILSHDRLPAASATKQDTPGSDLIAAANNVRKPSDETPAILTDDVFSVNSTDPNKLKMHLFERLGASLGVKMDDYASLSDYGKVIRDIVEKIRATPDGHQKLKEIERELGLTKLGLSIDILINAMINPGGRDDDKVDEALMRQVGGASADGQNEDPRVILQSMRIDETGTYGY